MAEAGGVWREPSDFTGDEVFSLLCNAEVTANPSWRCLRTTHWVMGLEWYKAVRRACLRPDLDDDDPARDETKWEPDPGDMVLGYRITVTGDGGVPHLADGRLEYLDEL